MKNWIKVTVKKKIKKKTKLGIIGLSYKEGTDSLKNAPSLDLINFYKSNEIFVYDPVVQLKKKKTNLIQLKKPEEIFKKSDVIFFLTKWSNTDFLTKIFKKNNLKNKIIVDPYGLFSHEEKKQFLNYYCI